MTIEEFKNNFDFNFRMFSGNKSTKFGYKKALRLTLKLNQEEFKQYINNINLKHEEFEKQSNILLEKLINDNNLEEFKKDMNKLKQLNDIEQYCYTLLQKRCK